LEHRGNAIRLKRNHNYHFHVQGQMNVTNTEWADFVVRTTNPYQLHTERIFIDKELWEKVMLPKRKAFYYYALLPETVSPMSTTISGIESQDYG